MWKRVEGSKAKSRQLQPALWLAVLWAFTWGLTIRDLLSGKATASLILSIVSLVMCVFNLVRLSRNIVGMTRAKCPAAIQRRKSRAVQASAWAAVLSALTFGATIGVMLSGRMIGNELVFIIIGVLTGFMIGVVSMIFRLFDALERYPDSASPAS